MNRLFAAALWAAFLFAGTGIANAQGVTRICQQSIGANGSNNCVDVDAGHPLNVNASVAASISGFTAATTGTPFTATTGAVTGTLPAGAVVVVSNAGTTNTAYCALGASATTSSQPIPPQSWFAYTVGASTQLTCITSASTTPINMTGGAGLPTGSGGGGGGGGGGGAITSPLGHGTVDTSAVAVVPSATALFSVQPGATLVQGSQTVSAADAATTSTVSGGGQVLQTGTPTANSAATFGPFNSDVQTIEVTVTGTFVGTYEFDVSADGARWMTSAIRQHGSANPQIIAVNVAGTAAASNVVGTANVSGYAYFRMRATAYTSGTATVAAIYSPTSANTYSIVALPPGQGTYKVTPPTLTDGQWGNILLDANARQVVNIGAGSVLTTPKTGSFTNPGALVGVASATVITAGTYNHVQIQNKSPTATIACSWFGAATLGATDVVSITLSPSQSALWGPTTSGVPTTALACIASAASTPLYAEAN